VGEGRVRENTSVKLHEIIKQRSRKLRKNSTPQEIMLWSRLKNRKFKNLKFRRQHPLGKVYCRFYMFRKEVSIGTRWLATQTRRPKRYDLKRTMYLRKQKFKNCKILEQ